MTYELYKPMFPALFKNPLMSAFVNILKLYISLSLLVEDTSDLSSLITQYLDTNYCIGHTVINQLE